MCMISSCAESCVYSHPTSCYYFWQELRINILRLQVSPLNDIDKILECEIRPTVADDSDASMLGSKQIFVKQYLVKWKGLSYLHCTW